MKKSLIALTLITLAVSACGKKEEPAVILPPASTPSLNTTDNTPPAPAVEAPPAPTTEPSAATPAPTTDSK